jgi:hypothetical protein
MMPHYKKITDLLHSYGVDVIFLDSDGNEELSFYQTVQG